jgi:hypothetical protein
MKDGTEVVPMLGMEGLCLGRRVGDGMKARVGDPLMPLIVASGVVCDESGSSFSSRMIEWLGS